MRLSLILLFVITSSLFWSCGDDNDEPLSNLNGNIDDIPFEAGDATFSNGPDNELVFNIYNNSFQSTDPCFIIPDGVRIFFSAQNTMDRQELFLDLQNFEGFTVTLFNPADFNNIIATDGYFQIVENDGMTITAELEAEVDDASKVVGQFSASLCQ